MLGKAEIIENLKELNAQKGRIVTVHTSLKAIGEIEGGGETLLEALIEFFTDDGGLLCIPTHTWDSDIYDRRKAESCIGVLPKLAAAHPDGIRTLHPTHSMTVFGEKKRVEDFIANEQYVDSPTNPDGCYGKIFKENGYVLLIGVDHTKNTYIHCIEEMLGIPGRLTDEKVEKTIIHKNGSIEKRFIKWFDTSIISDVSELFWKFEPAFRYYDCITDGFIGNAPSQLCSARKMKEVIERIYANSSGKEILGDNKVLDEIFYK